MWLWITDRLVEVKPSAGGRLLGGRQTSLRHTTIMSVSASQFEAATSVAELQRAFEKLKRSRFDVYAGKAKIKPGADGIQLEHFERDIDQHLRAASRKLRGGRYTFSPMLEVEIEQAGKKSRTISISTIRDAVVQRALYELLYDTVEKELTDDVFAYRRERAAQQAVRRVQEHLKAGRTRVLDADIKSFFDTVDHAKLMARVTQLNVAERLEKLIYRYLRVAKITSDDRELVGDRSNQLKLPRTPRSEGVPQGGVLSGLLANLFLADFDRALGGLGGYVRYADDFVVCCASSGEAQRAHLKAGQELGQLGLKLHPDKTTADLDGTGGVDFLGFRITPTSRTIGSDNIHRFKTRIRKVIETQHARRTSEADLMSLAARLARKIRGPEPEVMAKHLEHDSTLHPYRRCWIGFFRDLTDENQVRELDRWVRAQTSSYMWGTHHRKVTLSEMQDAGLPSLVNTLHRARARFEGSGDELPKGNAGPKVLT